MMSSILFPEYRIRAFVSRHRRQAALIDMTTRQTIGFLFRPEDCLSVADGILLTFHPNPYFLGVPPVIPADIWETVDSMMAKSPTNRGFTPDNQYDP